MDTYTTGYKEGWNDALMFMEHYGTAPRPFMGGFAATPSPSNPQPHAAPQPPKKKRKPSAYNKRLGRAIKDLTKRHKLKSGKWRKGWSQKRMMKAAHKAAKR
tara:strand:- start:271 stop:576 length:306 start_codon:yes stop_codon:yes gene_type:complete